MTIKYVCSLLALVVVMILGCGIPVVSLLMHQKTGVSEFLTGVWRQEFILLCMIPLAMVQVYFTTTDYEKLRQSFAENWLRLLLSSLGYCGWLYSVFGSLQYTSVPHVMLLSNVHSLLFCLYRLITCSPITKVEVVGVLLATGGTVVMVAGSMVSATTMWYHVLLGDAIAFMGSVSAVAYISSSSALINCEFPMFLLQLLNNSLTVVVGVCIASGVFGSRASLDANNGWFGWLDQQFIVLILFTGLVTGVIGASVLIWSMKQVDSLVVSILYLAEPIIATLIGVAFDVTPIPGTMTIVGGVIALLGVGCVVYGGRKGPLNENTSDFEMI
jgi:drug/metabolite transporter (DMT)-like permease